jgi:hypothetical protein
VIETTRTFAIDRQTSQKRLIHDDKAFFLYPRFSSDGKRILFVRNDAYANERKLIVCTLADWHCRIWLQTTATIRSPMELDENAILLSSSVVDTRWDGQPLHNKHDFFLLKYGSQPERLSNFFLHDIASISIADSRLVFVAREAPTKTPILDQVHGALGPGSDIYLLKFDQARRQIKVPSQPLKPLVLIEGQSTLPNLAPDGRIAFLNRRGRAATRSTHFNLAIASPDGEIERYIEASGWAFSRPVFVGNAVLANETFDKHYEVKSFKLKTSEVEVVAKLEYDQRVLRELEKISLTFGE